jgi:restriction endonuclease S subunit
MTLKEIVIIKSGIFRNIASKGDIKYLQVRDFTTEGSYIANCEPKAIFDDSALKHALKKNDILFSVKGDKNFATVFRPEIGLAVASSSFVVIRIRDEFKDRISSEYLTWYLNTPKIRTRLKSKAKGSALQSISINAVEELYINVAPLEDQNLILKIHKLQMREKEILFALAESREKLHTQKIYSRLLLTDRNL